MPTTTEMNTRSANAMAQRFADDACRERQNSLARAAHYLLWGIEALRDAGLPDNRKDGTDVREVLGIAMDGLSSALGLIEKDADKEGLSPERYPLDMTELEALWQATTPKPRFPETFCSNCGCGFGPGDHGFSHCESHAHLSAPRSETVTG